jgi:hypothetical protein
MGVSGQGHARPGRALAPGKGPAFLIVHEAGWAPELVWTQRLEEISFDSFGDQTPVVQSVVRHYTRGSQTVGRAVGPVGVGARVDCMKDIFSLNEIWVQGKIYIAGLKYLSLSTGTGSEL